MMPPKAKTRAATGLKDKLFESPAQQQEQRHQYQQQPSQQQREQSSRPQSSSSCSSVADGVAVAMTTQGQIMTAIEALLLNEDFLDRFAARIENRLLDSLGDSMRAAVSRIDELSQEVASLQNKITQLEQRHSDRLDDVEQYQRRNNIRISGVLEDADDEVTVGSVAGLLSEKLGVSIAPADIDRCHRVGRRPRASSAAHSALPPPQRPRQIIVKFVSYQSRHTIITNRRKLAGTGIAIHEDLTRKRRLFLKQVADKVGFRNVWSHDGRVVWKENGRIVSQSFYNPSNEHTDQSPIPPEETD